MKHPQPIEIVLGIILLLTPAGRLRAQGLDTAIDALARAIEAPLTEGALCALIGLDTAHPGLTDYNA